MNDTRKPAREQIKHDPRHDHSNRCHMTDVNHDDVQHGDITRSK